MYTLLVYILLNVPRGVVTLERTVVRANRLLEVTVTPLIVPGTVILLADKFEIVDCIIVAFDIATLDAERVVILAFDAVKFVLTLRMEEVNVGYVVS